MPLRRPARRFRRRGSPLATAWINASPASAQVQVPCRMMSGSPKARAAARSVWIGFQIEAHSV